MCSRSNWGKEQPLVPAGLLPGNEGLAHTAIHWTALVDSKKGQTKKEEVINAMGKRIS